MFSKEIENNMYIHFSWILLFFQLVDACITEDGDAFVYGARKVYRNFTMNTKVGFRSNPFKGKRKD